MRDSGYAADQITLRQLLQHTSGLWDYAVSDAYLAEVRRAPDRRWSREDQLRFAMTHGKPVGAPGAVFAYSDTGYILLGAILEARTGLPLAGALRQLLPLAALGLTSTWLESLEPAPAGVHPPLAQHYTGIPLSMLDPSSDLWGGGGLVSTTSDLVTFFDALFAGRVLHSPSTLAAMEDVPATNGALKAGMGSFRLDPGPGVTCFHHGGFWGTETVSCPALHATFSVTGTDAPADEPPLDHLFRRVLAPLTDCAGKPMAAKNRAPALEGE